MAITKTPDIDQEFFFVIILPLFLAGICWVFFQRSTMVFPISCCYD